MIFDHSYAWVDIGEALKEALLPSSGEVVLVGTLWPGCQALTMDPAG